MLFTIHLILKIPVPSNKFAKPGLARLCLAVRSSIAGTTIGALYHNYTAQIGGAVPLFGLPPPPTGNNTYVTTSNGWKQLVFDVAVRDGSADKAQRFPPLQLWVAAPQASASGVKVWVDQISVKML